MTKQVKRYRISQTQAKPRLAGWLYGPKTRNRYGLASVFKQLPVFKLLCYILSKSIYREVKYGFFN
jgi:hypothetical protein